ncbi:MAG: twin-arginine translocation signal domain-containing protein [Caldilineaceae bacterium]
MRKQISRRRFLQATGGVLSASVLAACVAPGGAPRRQLKVAGRPHRPLKPVAFG